MVASRTGQPTDRLWERYEQSVHKLLSTLDPSSSVTHNQRVPGRLSGVPRQVDVLACGEVVGVRVTVAVECKKHGRVVDVGVVDQFVGKLLDIGADRGIIYSYSGFTASAVTRAVSASHPSLMAVALHTPPLVQECRAPGYPADLLVEEMPPQWVEELDEDAFVRFLALGECSKFWS
ncbi:restriction endonuclease [Micromonospora sp. CA-263727]|uniref:restriction endonuclease n=1 Tax=Micromonospora sp. CA-263727 TaxID=3239967 RepID=UPI003D8BDFEB